MSVHVFCGPTLSAADVRAEIDAVVLPPAAQGDVYRSALERPRVIAVIDGYFERVPSVWHKEILWAMSQGVHVFGAASMGALRAAELATFGMVGVGEVFNAYASGELEDDDEVAVAHAAREDGYRSLSEAMVNIRATVGRAVSAGVVTAEAAEALIRIAKEMPYPDRSYPAVLSAARGGGVSPAEIGALRDFLPANAVSQKRLDAIEMLRKVRDFLATDPPAKKVRYHLERTDAWEAARRSAGRRAPVATATDTATDTAHKTAADTAHKTATDDAVVEELRIAGEYAAVRRGAFARALAVDAAMQDGRRVGPDVLRDAIEAFRRDRGLFDPEALVRWVEDQRIRDVDRFFEDEAILRWAEALFASDALRMLPDHLRSTGAFAGLSARAEDKERILAKAALTSPDLADLAITEAELFRWYFEEQLGRPVPASVTRYARTSGFEDERAFRRALLRELAYQRTRAKQG